LSPGEADKIGAVYKKERNKLLGYIRNRIHDRYKAEDILQDVFYQLTIGFNDIRRIENLTAWLYKVTDNRIIDIFRRKKPVTTSYNEDTGADEEGPLTLEEILPDLASDNGDNEIKEMIWDAIEDTLTELPAKQREVFMANEFDGISFREMSEKTGTPVNTLISRKRYAVLALRENLNELYKLLKNE